MGLLPIALLIVACSQRAIPIAAVADAGPGADIALPDAIPDPDLIIRPDTPGEVGPNCVPRPETCNERDDDCDGVIDDGFELATDPSNCGRCAVKCAFDNAPALCSLGQCRMGACNPNFVDLDGVAVNGCECELSNGGREICDGKDNDCDGTVDEGFDLRNDVANCGACARACAYDHATPICQLGVCRMGACASNFHDLDRSVRNGCEYACTVSAGGTEICDQLDNDCNGVVDESDPRAGTRCFPEEVRGCDVATGVCNGGCGFGTFLCLPGGLTCRGAVLPESELCDGKDNDCDGGVDEDFDLQNDPRWCGACGQVCMLPEAVSGCAAGVCVVRSCKTGFVDLDGVATNGCEYRCTVDGPEVCDGRDNDCDGRVDAADPDLLHPPANFCVQRGECGKGPGGSPRYAEATFPTCVAPTPGARPDWICNYPLTAQLFAPNQIAGEETLCDGLDNDCDGNTDEDMKPMLGSPCLDNGVGACKRQGVIRCAGDPTAVPICDVTGVAAPPPAHELCDGKDNDCDGHVDESFDTPVDPAFPSCGGGACRGVRDEVAFVAGAARPFYIYRTEASRVDATAADEGKLGTRACGRASTPVLPWANVGYAEAQAACAAAGMRLCRTRRQAGGCSSSAVTEDEWGAACTAGVTCGGNPQPYPYGCGFDPAICVGATSARETGAASGAQALCTSAELDPGSPGPDTAFDLSGNLAEWTEDCRTTLADGTGRRAYTLRGGSFLHGATALRCDFMSTVVAENFAFPDTGFRCCSSCRPGLADCGSCVDLASDAAHCGACGRACPGGQACRNGRCQ